MSIIKRLVVTLSLLGLSFSPALVAAETKTGTPLLSGFCIRASDDRKGFNTKISELENARSEKSQNIFNNLAGRKLEQDSQVQEKRTEAKENFEKDVDDLDSNVTTQAQKDAIAAFKAAVEAAMTTRKAAVDAAQQTFRTAVQGLVSQRQDAIKAAAAKLKAAITAALTKAQADCAAKVDATTVRTTLNAAIKAARDQFQIDIKAVEKIGQQVKDLTQVRNAAIKTANQAFKAAVSAARATLKAALGIPTTPTPTPEPTTP